MPEYTDASIPAKPPFRVAARSSEQDPREDHSSGKPDETGNEEQTVEELSDLSAGHRMHDYLHSIHILAYVSVK